ncbi:TniB family NTP-binding protein [Streptomyces odonnellii]|uniref:TniB family NTP-binding protein n=1 Tax=Streptomyces odonnellii TaxID=1417980 RepID=UPI000AF69216|nr:TniB family NTP-binding protein [Streptomyces odonnellii]
MVVVPEQFGMPDKRRMPTTTLPTWHCFVNEDPPEFELLAGTDWLSLSGPERDEYDEARVDYHSELIIVETPTIREILHQGRLLTLVNRREISARRGLIVSGPWATGKSTAIKQLGRVHELRVRQRYPDHDRIPVVYVSAPPNGSPRKLATRFAHFLGLPLESRHNEMDIADAVCEILIDARCDLVLVDKIHNIQMGTSNGKDMSDHLKYFAEHIPATFVYAGINVEREGLFTGVRGKQIAARCVMQHTANFPCGTEWRSMIATMEQALRLHHHEPGTLSQQAKYPHRRQHQQPVPPDPRRRDQCDRRWQRADHPPPAAHDLGRPQHPVRQSTPAPGNRRRSGRRGMTDVLAPRRLPPLPCTVAPLHRESWDSYFKRLAKANRIPHKLLHEHMNDPTGSCPNRRHCWMPSATCPDSPANGSCGQSPICGQHDTPSVSNPPASAWPATAGSSRRPAHTA